jgi:hypothetical protein
MDAGLKVLIPVLFFSSFPLSHSLFQYLPHCVYAFVFLFTSGLLKQMLKPSSGYKSGVNT